MDKRKYSSKKIKKIILAGVLIYLLLVIASAILMTGMIESRYLRLFVILAEIALGQVIIRSSTEASTSPTFGWSRSSGI